MRKSFGMMCLSGLMFAAACGGSSSAPQFTFLFNGKELPANSVIFGSYQSNEIVDIYVSDKPDLCASMTALGNLPADTNVAVIELKNYGANDTEPPITTGNYSSSLQFPSPGLAGGGEAATTDASCSTGAYVTLGGTITVSQFNDEAEPLTGSFALASADGGTSLEAAFTATACAKIADTDNGTCN